MSFRKNFFVLLSSVILVLIGCWLVGIPRHKIVEGLTLVIATVVMSLSIEDLWRKLLTARNLVTWQYILGFAVTMGAVLAWLWASESATNKEMAIRLGVTFFLAVVDGLWFAKIYSKSIGIGTENKVDRYEAKTRKRWAKYQTKFEHCKKEDIYRILSHTLRHRVVGNDIHGDLRFDQPLAVVDGKCLTLEELLADKAYEQLAGEVDMYIRNLAETGGR